MRTRVLVAVAIAFLIVAAGCRHDEQSMTGLYGNGVVQGQAIIEGGGSPAGVQVTLGGTGMTTTLSEDGRFTFLNAPENAMLHFQRGDGIDQTFNGRAGQTMSVTLNSRSSAGVRRRGAGPGGFLELEGNVSAIAADSITVNTPGGGVTAGITPSTIIRKGMTLLQPTDVALGTRVHVKVSVVGTVNTANEVAVQTTSGPLGVQMRSVTGSVTSVGADNFVVLTGGGTSMTVMVTPTTTIRKQGTTIPLTSLNVGDVVAAIGTSVDATTITGLKVQVEVPETSESEVELTGAVSAVGTSSITVNGTTVNLDASTVIRKQGQVITLAQIQVGDVVDVEGTQVDPSTVLAKRISVEGAD